MKYARGEDMKRRGRQDSHNVQAPAILRRKEPPIVNHPARVEIS
jgi:hypothetical protein